MQRIWEWFWLSLEAVTLLVVSLAGPVGIYYSYTSTTDALVRIALIVGTAVLPSACWYYWKYYRYDIIDGIAS